MLEAARVAPWMLLVLVACTEAPPGGAPAVAPASPCADLCRRIAECGAPPESPDVDACTRTCEEDPKQTTGPCREPRIAYERCMTAAPCEDVRDLEVAKRGTCADAITAVLSCEPVLPATPLIYFQF